MTLNKKTAALTTALCALSVTAFAATAPVHHSLLGKLLHHKPAMATKPMTTHHGLMPFHKPMASTTPMGHHGMTPMGHHGMMPFHHPASSAMSGGIIGNKHTHVFHMPGDKSLPAAQNRVYFPTIAAAQAAGYHAAGSMHKSAGHPMTRTMKHHK